jgi:hypothetical protein
MEQQNNIRTSVMQKIREAAIYKSGNNGASISIPKVFIDDNDLLTSDKIVICRDTINGMDVLLLIPVDQFQKHEEKLAAQQS